MRLHDFVAEHACRQPDFPAARCGDEVLTYRELDRRANALAHVLVGNGVRRGRLVGICAERGTSSLVGLLAILKAGGAYVPLDPEYPGDRLEFMLRDSEAATVVVDSLRTADRLPDTAVVAVADAPEPRDDPPDVDVSEDDLCYVIYTSGSVGRPKGSMNAHRGVVNTLLGLLEVLPVAPGFRIALVSSLNYDMSVFEVFGTWMVGGCVVVPRPVDVNDPDRLIAMLHDHQVNMWNSAPALYDMVLHRAQTTGRPLPDSLRVVALGGDRFPPDMVTRTRQVAPRAELFNLAGMTEVSYCSTWYRLQPEDAESANIPWGRALRDQRLYVLDDELRPVPDGAVGELCIGGQGVGLGYWHRPELTAQRFVPDPFNADPATRLYRTGDQVRLRDDGNLEFCGRLDNQVKIRGLRIELGEIETVIETHPAVVRSVVVGRGARDATELYCYYTAVDDQPVDEDELRALVQRNLPAHMTPTRFVPLAELPLLPSGKIDRATLAQRDAEPVSPKIAILARNEVERLVLARYAEIVGAAGIEENFFDAGGNSLLATKFVMRIRDELDIDLPIRALFNVRTLAEFAATIEAAGREQGRNVHAAAAVACGQTEKAEAVSR